MELWYGEGVTLILVVIDEDFKASFIKVACDLIF